MSAGYLAAMSLLLIAGTACTVENGNNQSADAGAPAEESAAGAALTAEADSVAADAEAAAKDAESALKEAEEEPAAPAPAAESRDVPSYSITAYCRKIGDTAGGSSMIEKACRDMEAEALEAIEARSIPARVRSYCDQIGRTAGGSYQIYNSCVDMEVEAAAGL